MEFQAVKFFDGSDKLQALFVFSCFLNVLNERNSNKTVSIFILKTIYFILQNMFRSLHTSSSVVHIKSTVNIQIIRVC